LLERSRDASAPRNSLKLTCLAGEKGRAPCLAIFLSTLVLISQNRLSEESEHRADLALHIGLLPEYELTRVLHMLDAIQDKMGIDNDADSDLADLEMETKPEDVLAEIERLQQRALRSKKPPA